MTQIGQPPCDVGAVRTAAEPGTDCPRVDAGCWWRPSSARAWPSSTAPWSTSRCPRSSATCTPTAFEAQWVIESYALFLAALLLVGGALGDRFGRRRVFMIGVALFALRLARLRASRQVQQLIVARAVQGIGAALLVPGSLALISASFPEGARPRHRHLVRLQRHHRGRRAGARRLPRRPLFVDLGLPGQPAARRGWCCDRRRRCRKAAARTPQRGWTWPARCSPPLALAGIVFAFIEAPTLGWGAPRRPGGAACSGIAAGSASSCVERRSRAPMLPLALFRIRNFAGANLLTLLLYAALGGGLYLLSAEPDPGAGLLGRPRPARRCCRSS